MLATIIAAAIVSQCPGGTCPPKGQVAAVPALVYVIPATTAVPKEVQVLSTETVTVTETVKTTQKRAGLIGKGVILKPLFGIRAGRGCNGSCN